ncbi:hypothetical protein Lal_00024229 [Lupinus albus]|nr:hypothetical protein Lal_00024229 [Lupinus albus]
MKIRTISLDVAVHLLVMGLRASLFKMELARDMDNMEDLRAMAKQLINLEETLDSQPIADYQPNNHSREGKKPHPMEPQQADPPNRSKYITYSPLNANRSRILQEVMATHLTPLPKKNPNRKMNRKTYLGFVTSTRCLETRLMIAHNCKTPLRT